MEKIIKICDKDIRMRASVRTHHEYKKMYSVGILEDVAKLQEKVQFAEKLTEEEAGVYWTKQTDFLMEVGLRMAYVMAKGCDKEILPYEDWLDTLGDGLFDNMNWLLEVMELAMSPFRRGVSQPTN